MSDIALDALPADHGAAAAGRQLTLADRLSGLRRRTALRLNDRTLLLAGSVLLPLGVVLVLLGWYGAAHTTRLFEEIPYLISGGLLGLTLAVIGGFLYFGYWLTRILGTARELLDTMLRIEDRLAAAPVALATPVAPAAEFVATRAGSMYHRPDCATVAGRAATDLRPVDAGADNLSPCRICIPGLVS